MPEYNKDHQFHLLRTKRAENECFTRIDRYSILRYWYENGKECRETLFYPSSAGMDEIKGYLQIPEAHRKKLIQNLINRYNQLINFGNGRYDYDMHVVKHKTLKRNQRCAKKLNRR